MERPYKVLVVTMWLINLKSASNDTSALVEQKLILAIFKMTSAVNPEIYFWAAQL